MNKTDKFGIPIEIGDYIVYSRMEGTEIYYNKVTGFTKCYILLEDGSKTNGSSVIRITDQIKYNKENLPEYFI